MMTRLERLEALQAQLTHEIERERVRAACEPRPNLTPEQRLARRGTTISDVRAWAKTAGVIPPDQNRGRLPAHVLLEYIDAHTPVDA